MARKKTDRFPKANSYRDRHGKIRWRYYEKGYRAELGSEWGSEEFKRRYADAENRLMVRRGAGAARTVPGTMNDLIARFYQLHFPTIEESTRADYRTVIEPFRKKYGQRSVRGMQVPHVMAIKADMHRTPMQANKLLKHLSQLMDLAVKLQLRSDNPVKAVDFYKTGSKGFHSWDEGEISRFYEIHQSGTLAHLAVTLILYTGAARCDVVKLGWHSIKDGRIEYRRNKTRKNPDGILVSIPVHPFLAEVLALVPPTQFTFLETAQGTARSPNGLGNKMREWCDAANLPLCAAHGLRKAICRRIAEAGGQPHEIMSVSGHITLAEAQRYTEDFGRKGLADSAIGRLPHGAKGEQNLVNHPDRFTKKTHKPLAGKDK